MQQNRAVFFVIIGVAVLVVIGMIVGTFYMFGSVGEVSPLQSEVSIEVAAAPTIYPWVEDAAIAFNQSHPKVQVSVIETTDLIPEARFRSTNAQSPPPAAWIADASFILALGQNKGLSFQDAQSVAGSPLAWGAYTDKLEQFNQTYGELNWDMPKPPVRKGCGWYSIPRKTRLKALLRLFRRLLLARIVNRFPAAV